MRKAAVVIGVDRTGNMTPLKAAAKGAEEVASWLKSENYDVICLTDQNNKEVTADQVQNAIEQFVTVPARYHMLVVYFSGHGQWHQRNDKWLLSKAPRRTHEAINLRGAMDLARFSGIPNVVFISDACRTIPGARTSAQVQGIDAFPSYDEFYKPSDIDYFKATSESRAAYEANIEGSKNGVLTFALMSAYKNPSEDMVQSIKKGDTNIDVVPNRKLSEYLQEKVNEITEKLSAGRRPIEQVLEISVPSKDDVYISKVIGQIQPQKKSILSFDSLHNRESMIKKKYPENNILHKSISNDVSQKWLVPKLNRSNEAYTGFVIAGAYVKDVKVLICNDCPDTNIKLHKMGDDENKLHRINIPKSLPASSLFIVFEDNRSIILPSLPGYIGYASLDEEGMYNLSFVPSGRSSRREDYVQDKNRVDEFRALVASKIIDNTFHINSETEAEALGKKIRYQKAVDPVLGLYAVLAFYESSKNENIVSVMDYMQNDNNVNLFDIIVLSSRIKERPSQSDIVVPLCPMLTQTWALLKARKVDIHSVLVEAKAYLSNSLWTTFHPEGTKIIMNAIEKGEL